MLNELKKKIFEVEQKQKLFAETTGLIKDKRIDMCYPPISDLEKVSSRCHLTHPGLKDFMIYKLSKALLKAEMLKGMYIYRSGQWMARIKGISTEYPKYYVAVNVDLFNGYEQLEVLYFCHSEDDKKVVEAELKEALGGKTLQETLYAFITKEAAMLLKVLEDDGCF